MISKIIDRFPKDIDYTRYILSVVVEDISDFNRLTSSEGLKVNGVTFKRFVGTTGGLKNNTLLFVNEEILDELNNRCECERDKTIPLVPAKYEAYKALTCSASQEIISPNKILVVSDCITKFKDTVINIDDTDTKSKEPKIQTLSDIDLENNGSDGYNLCTIEFMKKIANALHIDYVPSGVCLRNAWFKGMLYPFPILEFIEKYNGGNYFIKDIWGNIQDIRECEMIVTVSSLKLWQSYKNIEHYMSAYKKNGYEFSVTKISPQTLEDVREVNYQYLQSYEFSDDDIVELCSPTVNFLKKAMCGDYESTINFLGITGELNDNSWQQALFTNKYMMKDPYIVDSVHRMIKKKINDAKIGKLRVEGNYQIASGDPFALMQHVCGLEVTGLLKADEVYSHYWNTKNEREIVIFRSPMTSHNNIRKCLCVDNEDVNYWYQYMDTIMIINVWDTFCMAENGEDYDSDLNFSTNNSVLKRKHIKLPAIQCVQKTADKKIVIDEEIIKTNLNGMGNDVGSVTNRVTSMKEVQAHFTPDSKEYKELEYRMECGQLYQQNTLDKIKGIVSKDMPSIWYNLKACKDNKFLQSICAYRKPYFMIYVYDKERYDYKNYIEKNERKCKLLFNCNVKDLYKKENRTENENNFLFWYDRKMPVGLGDCSMNKICRYIESQFDGYKTQLKASNDFDYNNLKTKRRCTEEHRSMLYNLSQEYVLHVSDYKKNKKKMDKHEKMLKRTYMKDTFKRKSINICPNENERLNIMLDICYEYKNNKQFFWDCVGDLVIKRLQDMEEIY